MKFRRRYRLSFIAGMFIAIYILLNSYAIQAQSFKFALVTDTHLGGHSGKEDLERSVKDINQQSDIDFVILSGDVTEFGSDEELATAKKVLDELSIPLYVIPGNHDSNWSESGANTFRKVFGGETFYFKHKGYAFMGTTSGPNLRMSPGQVPRENLVWMDSIFANVHNPEMPLIFINHYPLDTSLNNWYEVTDRLLKYNTQLALCGHGHVNRQYEWDGILGVMCRSNLRAKDSVGGYNILEIDEGKVTFSVRRPGVRTEESWLSQRLEKPKDKVLKRPDYSMNENQPDLKKIWEYNDDGDIGSGMALYKNKYIIAANTKGKVYALDYNTGNLIWSFNTGGKIYSTPAVYKDIVVVGSSDSWIYGLNAKTGEQLWSVKAEKAVLGSPKIEKGVAYIGASDGVFRAVNVNSGKVLWTFDKVKGFVTTLPTLDGNKVLFGSWENGFYCLDKKSGELLWEWNNGHGSRMFSPAACYPVVVKNRVFIVAPDRYMTALDLNTGDQIWRNKADSLLVRESMGVSVDKKLVYVKAMGGKVYGISTRADSMQVAWTSSLNLSYEIAPTAIFTNKKQVIVPSDKGVVSSLDAKTGHVLWQYKISNALVNPPLICGKNSQVVSAMDGRIVRLDYPQ